MNIAIIPARSGSKRIKNKNIKLFNNKPIISYVIKTCIESGIFSKIFVSTDSKKIANISKKYGAEILLRENKKLSNDFTPVTQVIKYDIKKIKKITAEQNYYCCILPTSPLLKPIDLKKSFKTFKTKKNSILFSVNKFSYPIQRSFYLKKDGHIEMYNKRNFFKRSQDLKSSFHDAGQFYWGKEKHWNKNNFFSNNCFPYLLNKFYVQDIDDYDDWKYCEFLFKYNLK